MDKLVTLDVARMRLIVPALSSRGWGDLPHDKNRVRSEERSERIVCKRVFHPVCLTRIPFKTDWILGIACSCFYVLLFADTVIILASLPTRSKNL